MTTTVTAGTKQLTVLEGSEAKAILRLAETGHLPEHFKEIVSRVEAIIGKELVWKPFGGEGRVAHSALGSAAESTHLLSEPVINFLDAALEMASLLARINGDTHIPADMYEAAEYWFGIPAGGLPHWKFDTPEELSRHAELARQSQMLLRHGSHPKMPTAVFLDNWLGQHPADHEDTILSLQKGLKQNIPFLAGQYGHGAGFTLAFSHGGQIIVGRRHPELLEAGYDDLVGLSLVIRRMPSETGSANPTYWYAVCPDSQTPLAFHPTALGDPGWHGIRRVCIDYEMQKTTERDIYFALDHNINRPALPYAFKDERLEEGSNRQFRYMNGNATRLQRIHDGRRARPGKNPIRVPHRRESHIDLSKWMGDGHDYGHASVITTYVKQDNTGKGNELYAPVKEAEVWTLNGQRHHARSRLHFGQEPIRLEAIRDNLLVEIRLDKLSPDAKALILTTDRQGAAEREVRFGLEHAIDDLLKTDSDLRGFNDAARDEALSRAASSRMQDLDRELSSFEHFVRIETVKIRTKVKKKQKRRRPPAPKVELAPLAPLRAEPTFLQFRKVLRDKIRIAPGRTASVLLEADVVDGYFDVSRQPSFQFTPDVGAQLQVYGADDLKDGRMRVRIRAQPTAALGTTTLTASYLPPRALAPLTTNIDVVVAEPTPRQPGLGSTQTVDEWEEREEQRPAPPMYQVLFEDRSPSWVEAGMHEWTADSIGEYKNDVAYVNGSYTSLVRLLKEVKPQQQQEYLTLYLAPIIMTLVGLAKEEADPPKDEDGNTVELHETFRKAALQGAALSSLFTIRKLRKLSLLADDDLAEED
jgi:hypothetical protein